MTREQALQLKSGDEVTYKLGGIAYKCKVVEENACNPWATWRYDEEATEPIAPRDEFGYRAIYGENNFFAWLSVAYPNVVQL